MLVFLGTLTFVASTVPVVLAAWRLAGLYSTERVQRLATTLLITMLIIVLLLSGLGLLGLWYPVWQVLSAWIALALVVLFTRRIPQSTWAERNSADEDTSDIPNWVKFITVTSLVAALAIGIILAIFFPDLWDDSLLYHRGILQDFLHARSLWHIGSFDNGIAYEGAYPSNVELFAFWTTLAYGRDFLTGLHGFVWMGALLGTMYTIGRDLGLRKWSALISATFLFLLPETFRGGGVGGLLVDSFILCCATFALWGIIRYVKGRQEFRWLLLVGFSSGLAVGAKLTSLVLFLLLCAGLVVTAWRHGHRLASLAVLVTGALPVAPWLLRLWVMRGNPIWPTAIGPFPGAAVGWTEGTYFLDPRASLAKILLQEPGKVRLLALLVGMSLLMWGILGPLIVVSIRSIWRRARREGLLWPLLLAPLIALFAHVVTPITGLNEWYAANAIRYIAPMLVIMGLALGVTRLAPENDVQRRWHKLLATGLILNWLLLDIVQFINVTYVPLWIDALSFALGIIAAWWIVYKRGSDWIQVHHHVMTWACAIVAGVVAVATWVGRTYSWYPQGPLVQPFQPVYDWISGIHGENIAFVASFRTPLGGSDLSNTVYYLGEPRENYGMGVWRDPDAWIQALKDTCTDYLVVGRSERFAIWLRPIPEWHWAQERDDVFRRVAGGDDAVAYEFLPRKDKPAECRTLEELLTR